LVTVVALFNLKPGVSVEQYEAWAGMYDLPTVRGLSSVQSFEILRAQGLLSGDGASPYQYVEVLRIESVDAMRAGIRATPAMAAIQAQFQQFADAPLFIVTTPI